MPGLGLDRSSQTDIKKPFLHVLAKKVALYFFVIVDSKFEISKALLLSESQSISLFTSAASNQRGCILQDCHWYREIPNSVAGKTRERRERSEETIFVCRYNGYFDQQP